MIHGSVTRNGVPQIQLSVRGHSWPATVDTGFNGGLELPVTLLEHVDAKFVGVVESSLAAGQRIVEDCYLIEFTFDGEPRIIEATFADTEELLIGTELLTNHILSINFPNRTVSIERPTI